MHGRETRAKRAEYRAGMAELRRIEDQMFALGMFPEGTKRTPGRKPGFKGGGVEGNSLLP